LAAKLVTCKNNLPAGGGICDASALQGAQSGAATALIDKDNVQVILGCNTTFTGAVNPTISFTANSPSLVGCGMGSTIITTSSNTADVVSVAGTSQRGNFHDFQATQPSTRTGGAAIRMSGGNAALYNLYIPIYFDGISFDTATTS